MAVLTAKKKPIRKTRVLFILFCVAIPVINWLIMYVYAHLSAFGMAFQDAQGKWTLENFIRFFEEFTNESSTIRIAFKNTFLTFGIQLVLYPFQVLVSYFIYKKIPGATVFRILFFLPSILFSVCVAMMFTRIVGVNGFIAQWIGKWMELDYVPELLVDSRFANATVLTHMIWLSIPGDLILLGGTFARIPNDVIEAGIVDGTTWWTEFTRITIPMVWPTVALQMILKFCGIFGASGSVFLLTGGDYGTMTLNTWMYKMVLSGAGNVTASNTYNYLSAVGMILSAIAIAISLTIRNYTDKAFNDVEF